MGVGGGWAGDRDLDGERRRLGAGAWVLVLTGDPRTEPPAACSAVPGRLPGLQSDTAPAGSSPQSERDWGTGWPCGRSWGGELTGRASSHRSLFCPPGPPDGWGCHFAADLFLLPMMQLCLPASSSLSRPDCPSNLQSFQVLWGHEGEAAAPVAIPNRARTLSARNQCFKLLV